VTLIRKSPIALSTQSDWLSPKVPWMPPTTFTACAAWAQLSSPVMGKKSTPSLSTSSRSHRV
jgi:hypothetical protein